MAKKEEWNEKHDVSDEDEYSRRLEKQITELHKANEETIRLKNVEKFAATGRMARSLAHEVRNPLTNISLALEQLNAELPHNDDASLLIEMISRNTMRINSLITELLNSTKFSQLQFSDVSINEILDEIIEQVRHFAKHKNAELKEDLTEPLPNIIADKEKIKIAFENLLTYTVESVQPNEGNIFVKTANENNKCVITVQSNGAAISEEKLERLFEPQFTNKQGSGLALTYTQNIILNHGGTIYVESEQGKGTVFTIILDFA